MGNLNAEGSGVRAPGCDESILISIKKMLGLDANYDAYNTDIIVFINSAMMTLQQLGVGPKEGFVVTGLHEMWSDFLPSDTMLEGVKSYIYLCVKMVFDPPTSSYVMESMKAQKEELEWRIREQAEFYPGDGTRLGYFEQLAADEEAAKSELKGEILETEAGIVRIVSVRDTADGDD
jgi:hypothetical protein